MKGAATLVTGGAGFIGSHLTDSLLASGTPVVVLDNFDSFYDPAIKRRNIEAALENPHFRLVEGDLRDRDVLDRMFAEYPISQVVHLAARAGVRPSIDDPGLYTSVNLDGTTSLLEACRRHEVKKFVFGSSSSVYGNNKIVPFSEAHAVDHPTSPYAATKRAGELICHTYHHLFGFSVACLRFFTVYGPRQRPEMAIHKFARLMADGQAVDQYGDGTSSRDYTYVSDIVIGIRRALECCAGYHLWNLGGSQTITLAGLLDKIATGLEVSPEIRRWPDQPGDVERTWANIEKAGADLEWAPRVDIDRGLELFLAWFREQGRA